MEPRNHTAVPEFLLLGLTEDPALQPLIFSLFLSMYLVTILGNLLIILAVISDPHLHTPMYVFLCNLSFNDICFSTSTIPKMLVNILTEVQSTTYTDCLSQVCFVLIFGGLENCLLTVMAYDRYVAICHPLRYTVIMNPCLCVQLILISLLISTVDALLHTLMVLRLSFCTEALEIPHFFCDLAQVIKLACSDTLINNLLVYLASGVFAGAFLCGIIFSYIHIVTTVLRMPSSGGKHKAFSTCGSHLCVVSLFYGTAFGVYISSAVTDSPRKTAVASVMYSVVPQMLNPFIYSLRNRDMKEALRKLIDKTSSLL
ncbi:olfactory receptor 7G2 [Ictidomys tridecemlineatus]